MLSPRFIAAIAVATLALSAARLPAQFSFATPVTSPSNVPGGLTTQPAGSLPYLGNATFALSVDNPGGACPITSGSATAIIFSTGTTLFPVPLPSFGCQPNQPGDVLIDPLGYLATAFTAPWTGAGSSVLPLPIPVVSSLFGARLVAQGIFVDPAGPTGVALTDGLDLFLGNNQNAPPPSNNDCANAIPIGDGITMGSNVGATFNPPPLPCTTGGGFADSMVWYAYTASCTGTATASFCQGSANFNTVLAAFDGTCAALNQLACNDDTCSIFSEVTFAVTQGSTYYLAVAGWNGMQGSFSLSMSCQ